jgi:hypothetical protein
MSILKGFVGASYQSAALTADAELTMNWYVEAIESPYAPVQMALYPTPGVVEISAAANGPGRAHFFMNGREFAVIATLFIEIDNAGTMTTRGTVALDAFPATISSNGDGGGQLFITSGSNGYIFDLATNTLTQIAALNGKATMGDHLDGYFLALDASNSTLYISALLDGLTWSTGLDFAQRSAAPDPWTAMVVAQSYVWLLGELTSEVWYNSGESFPFTKHPSGLVRYGCAARFSAEVVDQGLTWLSTADKGGYEVVRAVGFNPEAISTYPLEREIGDYAVVDDAVSDVYMERGHTFYLLTFPTEDTTHAWDLETKMWCGRGTWTPSENSFTAWRPRWHAFAFGEHRMLDAQTGSLYRMSSELGLDVGGMPIRRLRRAPAVFVENRLVLFPGFEVDLEVGLGLATGQGSDPQVMARWSNDGGRTWGPEQMRGAGKTGEYGHRVRWNRTGAGRRRVFEVSVSDPIPWRLLNAYLTPEPTTTVERRGAA